MDETTLSQQEMQLKNLETEFNRIDQLYKVGGVSKSEWDNVNLQLEVARKSFQTLKENTQLASPIDGVVTARNYDNGDLYGGQAILVVQKIAPVKITINVSEQYYSKVKKGDEVSIELDAYPGETFTGKVSLIYPTVDAMTHTFPVEINVANTDQKLRPGMFARATLNLGTLNHVVVPDLAIEKRSGSGLSISSTPAIFPSLKNGTTISDLDAGSQAMCPGNLSTSGTTTVCSLMNAVPQTPFPFGILMQALFP